MHLHNQEHGIAGSIVFLSVCRMTMLLVIIIRSWVLWNPVNKENVVCFLCGLFQGSDLGQIHTLTEHRDRVTVILGGINSISLLSHHFYFIKSDPGLHSWERRVSETEMSFSDVRCLQRK